MAWETLSQTPSPRVLLRGGGEMASGVAHRLFNAGLDILITEVPEPLAVRRAVSFCEAVFDGAKTVEGLTARSVATADQAEEVWDAGELPVIVDPHLGCLAAFRPDVVIDALLAKRNTGLKRQMAGLTIGLGPGFNAPHDVHVAVETMRGHDLGRLIYQGAPSADTGVPGAMAGITHQRVLRSPAAGRFQTECDLGDRVSAGQVLGQVAGRPVISQVDGILRGLIRPGMTVSEGLKIGDVDPRGDRSYLDTISDKARALGGAVLAAIMGHLTGRSRTRQQELAGGETRAWGGGSA